MTTTETRTPPAATEGDSQSNALSTTVAPQTVLGKDALARLAEYDSAQFNILQPVVIDPEAEFSGTLAFSVGVVQIDPRAGHTYNDFIFANENKGDYALSALGLQAIARSAGVKVTTEQEEYRRDPESGHVYCRFKATVYMLQPNGQPYEVEAHASNDTATLEESLRFDYAQPKGSKPGLSGAELETKVQKMVLQRKSKIEERTETEAMNRAMRKAFGLKQTYNEKELKGKPFVTLRVVERPSVYDTHLAIEQGGRAVASLYGSDDPSVSAGQVVARELPPGSTSVSTEGSVTVEDHHPQDSSAPELGEGRSGEAVDAEAPESAGGVTDAPPADDGRPDDLEITKGRYMDRMVSEIALEDPAYLEECLQGRVEDWKMGVKEMRLVSRWMAWARPQLEAKA